MLRKNVDCSIDVNVNYKYKEVRTWLGKEIIWIVTLCLYPLYECVNHSHKIFPCWCCVTITLSQSRSRKAPRTDHSHGMKLYETLSIHLA